MAEKIDAKIKQSVTYCIPLWLRDEQIKLSIERNKPRIEPVHELRAEPCAIACFGPSLNDTWQELSRFRFIFSCSGSHKFLIDRGIVPTWHVEVDPREHKVELMGSPHKDVEYLISSTCHPKLWDHLEGFNIKLWHVFSNEQEAQRVLPPEEWALTGGCSVGLRAMTIARFLGFTEQHIFGMDGCEGATGKHAAPHPNQASDHRECEYGGKTYLTTPSFLEAARQTFHELDQMPDVKATFYGEGLVQAMAKDYKPNPIAKEKAMIAFSKPELISAEYKELNRKLHRESLAYGVGGGRYAKIVFDLAKSLKTTSILDYGSGKGYLAKALPFPIWEYDPAVEGKEESPRPADIVVCTDVLEHIEPEKLSYVLNDLKRCVKKIGYFSVHTGASTKCLPDGRNAHLIQHDRDWWTRELLKHFTIGQIFETDPVLHIVVGVKAMEAAA